MKKLLAICSIFFTVCTGLTSCGSNDTEYDSNDGTTYSTMNDNSVGEHVSDAIHGAGEAGGSLIEGITDAAGDIVDGLDGEDDTTTRTITRTTTSRR
ncbi:MAG: hypothetical protein IKO47_12540 [Ruminococcus sp.]|nr:hypothetical protein [Ruminococcus sp.]